MTHPRPFFWHAEYPVWFEGDGCTKVPDYGPDTRHACNQHDWRYWLGGDASDKAAADRELRRAIIGLGGPRHWFRGWRWWLGLRLFSWLSNKRFRWGGARLSMSIKDLKDAYIAEKWEAECERERSEAKCAMPPSPQHWYADEGEE